MQACCQLKILNHEGNFTGKSDLRGEILQEIERGLLQPALGTESPKSMN